VWFDSDDFMPMIAIEKYLEALNLALKISQFAVSLA